MRRSPILAAAATAAAVVAAAVAAVPAGAATAPSISIARTSVKDGTVVVTAAISGWKLLPARVGKKPNAPGGGHWHIFVDGKYVNFSAARTGTTKRLAAGDHTIVVELANNDHSSLSPRVRSAPVKVTVPPAAAASGGGAATTQQGGAGSPPATTTAPSGGSDTYGY